MQETSSWSKALSTIDLAHRDYLRDHLLRLDGETRLQRFCHLAVDAHVRDYVEQFDFASGRVIGCFAGGAMRGAAELRRSGAARSTVFEATFSVEKDWQGRGIGTALILRAISVARGIGGHHILVDRLASSARMRRILAQFDSSLHFDHDDCKAWLPLVETSRDRKPRPPQTLQRSFHPQD